MNDSVFEIVEKSSQILKLDFSSIEFAKLAEEQELSEAQIQAVGMVFEHLQQKKIETTIHTLLKMSRLPLKDPKTFDNFDFSVIKGRDAAKLKTLPSLSAIYAHRNLAFIGPAGTGKTHLAQAFGYECCQRGIKTYFIKMSELRDKFSTARRTRNSFARNGGNAVIDSIAIPIIAHSDIPSIPVLLIFTCCRFLDITARIKSAVSNNLRGRRVFSYCNLQIYVVYCMGCLRLTGVVGHLPFASAN